MSENEPAGYFFLLPSGSSVRTLPIGEVGGAVREVTAEQAAAYPQLVEVVRQLVGLCDYGDFSNGIVGPNGVDQGSVQARCNFIEPARHLLYSLGETVGDEPEGVQLELSGRACDDPFGSSGEDIGAAPARDPEGLLVAASAYRALLLMPPAQRILIQPELCQLRNFIAESLNREREDVQNAFESAAAISKFADKPPVNVEEVLAGLRKSEPTPC